MNAISSEDSMRPCPLFQNFIVYSPFVSDLCV
jgi:hypothetical protein